MTSVLIVVFDGLQPAQVRPELMPNLSRFASEGVFFEKHHPVFPSVTRINAASMVTGRYPGGHGLAANTMVARDYDPALVFSALEPVLAKIKAATGQALLAPTLADILGSHGLEYTAIGVGTSGNAYVHNPNADGVGGATIHPDFTLPYPLHKRLVTKFGAWPGETSPNTPRFDHAVRILTEHILPERSPAVALIWSSEPDKAQHAAGVGSEASDRAIREADERFGRIIRWIESNSADPGSRRHGRLGPWILDDSGDGRRRMVRAQRWFRGEGRAGGSERWKRAVLLPRHGHDDRLAAWLMAQPWCGALLASETAGEIEGTLPMSLSGGDGPRAPELAMSLGWDSRSNGAGYAGFAHSTGGAPGLGQHGSMSRHEMNNVLIARGPSFKRASRVKSPTGNVDVAPTVLRLLGHRVPDDIDGRVLVEALVGGPESVEWDSETRTGERRLEAGMYCQHVRVSRVGTTTYLDEGNGWREG